MLLIAAAGICVAVRAGAIYAGEPPELRAAMPKTPSSATTVAGFAPPGWTVERAVLGDLNRDGRPDAAMVLKGKDPACLVKTDGPSDPMDSNPRLLVVAFGNGRGFDLAVANAAIIPRIDDPYMDDPFVPEGLEIRRGILCIALTYWRSMGGWGSSSTKMSFRWNGRDLRMIGFDREALQRNSGRTETTSVNFLTGRVKVVQGSIEDDVDDVTRWRRVFREEAPTLERMGDGLAFEPRLLGGRK